MSEFEKDIPEQVDLNDEEKALEIDDSADCDEDIADEEHLEVSEQSETENEEIAEQDDSDEYLSDENFDVKPEKGFKLRIAGFIMKMYNGNLKKMLLFSLAGIVIVVLGVLVYTDIIPILPNAYNRSYVGKTYTLDETHNCEYDKLGNNVVYAGGGKLYCFGPDMKVIYEKNIYPGNPIIRTNGENGILYFKNTGEFVLLTENTAIDKHTDEEIISAYMSDGMCYSLVTKASSGHKSCVSVYSAENEIYKWLTGNTVMDSAITSDVSNMVASVVEMKDNEVVSSLVFFDLNKSEPVRTVDMGNNLIFELYTSGNKIIAIGDNGMFCFTNEGHEIWNIDYALKNVKSFDISDNGTIGFIFDEYNSPMSESYVELYNFNGKRTGRYESKKNIRGISLNNGYALFTLGDCTVLTDNSARVQKVNEFEYNFGRVELYENYNFGFMVHDGISEIVSVKH